MLDVALATNLHDVNGIYKDLISVYYPRISEIYPEIYAVYTSVTDPATVEELDKFGVKTELQIGGGVGLQYISDARRQALKASLRNGHNHTHVLEIDRLLQWVHNNPVELASVVAKIPLFDFTVFGRTSRAFESHPRSQVETERLVNKVLELILHLDYDFLAASRGISKQAAEIILQHSISEECGTDSEWPIIIHCCTDLPISYIEVEGLEWEAWFRFPERVTRTGSVEEYKKQRDSFPGAWTHRITSASQICLTAMSTYESLCNKLDNSQ